VPEDERAVPEQADRADLLFGLLSVMGQFAGVLKERGRDYQRTSEGQELSSQLTSFYRALGQREKEVLDTVLASLGQLVERLHRIDEGLSASWSPGKGGERNGMDGSGGRDAPHQSVD
jgi:hypothetical protein